MFNLKICFSISQLIGSCMFLGYSISSRNYRLNFFFLGKRLGTDIFNLNLTYFYLKSVFFYFSSLFALNANLWVLNNSTANKLNLFTGKGLVNYKNITVCNSKLIPGSFTNRKNIVQTFYIKKRNKFPSFVFICNLESNFFSANECYKIFVPSFGLIDSNNFFGNLFFPVSSNSKSIRSVFFSIFLIFRSYIYSKIIKSFSFLNKVNNIFVGYSSRHIKHRSSGLKGLKLKKFKILKVSSLLKMLKTSAHFRRFISLDLKYLNKYFFLRTMRLTLSLFFSLLRFFIKKPSKFVFYKKTVIFSYRFLY